MTPDSGGSWIIFGGAFDPVHLGHLHLAKEIRAARKADGVLYLPSFIPPHKPGGCFASFDDRLSMLKLALEHDDHSFISPSEAARTEENYSLNSVRALKKQFPDCQFSFLVGTDNLSLMQTWHKPDELLAEVQILVGSRSDEMGEVRQHIWDDRIVVIETTLLDVSSTQVRVMVADGAPMSELSKFVPLSVANYIDTARLYQ